MAEENPNGSEIKSSPSASLQVQTEMDVNPNQRLSSVLINEFAAYLQLKKEASDRDEASKLGDGNPTALLGKFAGFLANSKNLSQDNTQGILTALKTALKINQLHDLWIIDSGATDHMTNQVSKLHDFKKLSTPSYVSVANGEGAKVVGVGNIYLVSDKVESKALFVPSFPFQLLSVGKITLTLNCSVIFSPHNVIFQDCVTKEKIGEGFFLDGLYYLSMKSPFLKGFQAKSALVHNQPLWHQRLAHPSEPILSRLFSNSCKEVIQCETCHFSKSTRLPFGSSSNRSSQVFELVHTDVWGPFFESFDGYKYFVTFIDDFSRVTWLYLLKSKSEVFAVFQDFHNLVKNHFTSKIQTLRSDNGSEYMSHIMQQYLSMHGILHQTSCVGTPQQNGIAERKNRDLLEKTRALMLHMKVPKRFWSQGVMTAAYIINRLPSRVLEFKSPMEVLKGRNVSLSHLRVFGCTCYVHIQTQHRDKLDPRAHKCIFLSYSSTQKGYKCYSPEFKRIVVSKDVRFDETNSFYKLSDDQSQGELFPELIPLPRVEEPAHETQQASTSPSTDSVSSSRHNTDHQTYHEEPHSAEPEELTEAVPQVQYKRNPVRDRHPPIRLQDYVTYSARHPINGFISYKNISPSHAAFLNTITSHCEPRNFQEASCLEVWKKAMDEELQALTNHKTWSVVRLPHEKKAVGSTWIYKIKFHSDGSIERHKARLVAQGFSQTYDVDYKETFASVAKMNTVRVLLSVAVNKGWSLYQMDVKNAFLHGDLEEEVYMKLPPGHPQSSEPGLVCKLHKSIYGLKQSPRAWYAKLSSVLERTGFQRSNADSSMFIRTGVAGKLVVLIYVDDLIITGDSVDEIANLKSSLQQKFSIKDLGVLKYFLGIEMASSKNGLFLNQRKYTLDLLQESNMQDVKPVQTPLDCKLKLNLEGTPLPNVGYYQRLVGKLIYLTITRPDITFAVSLASQFMHSPTTDHFNIVKRILRYLKGSIGRGILMRKNDNTQVMGYCDADWAGNAIDRKSTTGYCTFVGGNLVTWKSKKQSVIARSNAEAEYRSMASTACELIWLKGLLVDLGFHTQQPMSLFCDNQAAMHIASNPVFHERTKHIEVDCHYVRAQVQNQVIQTIYTRSADQLADIFTKPLPTNQFQCLLSKLGSINPMDPA